MFWLPDKTQNLLDGKEDDGAAVNVANSDPLLTLANVHALPQDETERLLRATSEHSDEHVDVQCRCSILCRGVGCVKS